LKLRSKLSVKLKWYETAAFKNLQADWYQKLAETGFEDIEKLTGQGLVLKQTSKNRKIDRKTPEVKAAIAGYFRLFSESAATGDFDNEIDRVVITLYTSGVKTCRILEHLREHNMRRCRTSVFYIIKKYEKKWGIK
jgi:hypothetical protein